MLDEFFDLKAIAGRDDDRILGHVSVIASSPFYLSVFRVEFSAGRLQLTAVTPTRIR
ncbi:MAG: hypothetical protein V3T83_18530 [Acidobacteriota bacterium]